MSSSFTEDHLVEQPAVQLIRNELGWDLMNCYDEWSGGVNNQGRDGKREGLEILNVGFWILNGRGRRPALQRLNPDLPVAAIEGAVEEMEILNDEFWILNRRGRWEKTLPPDPMLPAPGRTEAIQEIDNHLKQGVKVAWAPLEPLALAIHRFPK